MDDIPPEPDWDEPPPPEDVQTVRPPAPAVPRKPTSVRGSGRGSGRTEFNKARQALNDPAARRAEHAQAPGGPAAADDTAVSEDDENIADTGAVGQPVIASVLGGIVIDESID